MLAEMANATSRTYAEYVTSWNRQLGSVVASGIIVSREEESGNNGQEVTFSSDYFVCCNNCYTFVPKFMN